MKWPWVSRKRFDALLLRCLQLQAQLDTMIPLDNALREIYKQADETKKLAAIVADVDEKFMKALGVKLPEGD
jgi:hypothetical protein